MQFFKNISLILTSFLISIHKLAIKNKNQNKKKDYIIERKQVADLIMAVLVGKLSVREALLKFPKNCNDKVVSVAWHALVHLEADEDISQSDILFKDTQIDFLEGLYNILITGGDLPENLIKGYNKYHSNVDTSNSYGKEYFWNLMKKNINIQE